MAAMPKCGYEGFVGRLRAHEAVLVCDRPDGSETDDEDPDTGPGA
ncbi:hypothetical protein AFCDBAGC_0175 [Methylobacterium cerastii]|uniref:Transposase n=2 Tax=Methylobacterium TaxID=407 RepID=A0ABQ4U726_9HYPH|nr:hypothetical protein AFCDBAGC_0175 [Methylobacterium cerastii]GJE62212.1 hypothetical protein MPOCJGCO_4342 [Methylobacterium trifolii]